MEIENNFLPITEKITLELLQKHQNFDPVIRQLKFWHKNKTKLIKADINFLRKKPFLYISEKSLIPLSLRIKIF